MHSLLVYSGDYNPSIKPQRSRFHNNSSPGNQVMIVVAEDIIILSSLFHCPHRHHASIYLLKHLRYSLFTNQPQKGSGADRKTELSGLWFYSLVRQWYLRGMCVCLSVYWVGSDRSLLILVHRITPRLSHPITEGDC